MSILKQIRADQVFSHTLTFPAKGTYTRLNRPVVRTLIRPQINKRLTIIISYRELHIKFTIYRKRKNNIKNITL